MSTEADNAGVRFPPPLIFLAALILGLLLRSFFPMTLQSRPVAILFLLASLALAGWGLVTMLNVETGIIPHRPATALITWGPFAYSRNPLYISIILGYLSAALWTGAFLTLLLLPVALVVLQKYVIAREEAYLTRRFGDEYRRYCARVGRWVGPP